MSRRVLTLLLSGVLAALLAGGAAVAPVPYVAYLPGPTFDTLGEVGGTPVIAVDGRPTFPTEGHLDLTTVSVRSDLSLGEAVLDWFDRDRAVVPREFVFPPGQSDEQVRLENEQRKLESESTATIAALRQLGVPFTTSITVQRVEPGMPADGALQDGDVVTSVDGRAVASSAELRERVSGTEPGTDLRIGYVRGGEPGEAVVTTAKADGEDRSIIGVLLQEVPEYGFDIDITLQDVGGPSAGLMFALGIIDKLTPGSLAGGADVAGTGTIAADGTVGPIGGIVQKMYGAVDAGAEVFLAPAGNCDEVVGSIPEGLDVFRVATLDEAIGVLQTVADDGDRSALARCGS